MGFFDEAVPDGVLEPPLLRARQRDQRYQPPRDWVLPAVLPWGRRLAEGSATVIALDHVECWPEGATLQLRAMMRDGWDGASGPPALRHPRADGWHVGLEFADGRRVVHLDGSHRGPQVREVPPDEPLLVMGAGSSWGPYFRTLSLYLTPLPAGPWKLVTQWRERGIEETVVPLDGDAVRERAAEAIEVWTDLPEAPPSASTVTGGGTSVSARPAVRRERPD
ncbi:hypothetical protein GCM10009836_62840 [Pseudonocardia ailaonensis]|uniref:Uncharacterized protein n=1 Tax=Pseudonocardia ailaonensis TaxID=367279 RepID=A0ABN2NKH4_9PSEU